MMETIDRFIETYNDYLKIKTRIYNDVKLIIRRNNADNLSQNPIHYFLNTFQYPKLYNYSGFCFADISQDVSKDNIHFATHVDYNMFYVYGGVTDMIHLWDIEKDEIEWDCAKTPNIFFECMCEVMKTKIVRIKSENFSVEESYLNSVFKTCMSLNGNDARYSIFYQHILGID